MIPVKTKLIVTINKVKNDVSFLFNDLKKSLTENELIEYSFFLKNDLCFLLYHFYSNYSFSFQYETLLVSSINSLISSNIGFKSFDYINIIGKWNNLTEDKRNVFISSTIENIKSKNQLECLVYLKEINQGKFFEKTSNFIISIAKKLIETDNITLENEKIKLEELFSLIKSSKKKINENKFKEYINKEFNKLTLTNNKSIVINPEELKDLIIKSQENIIHFDKNYLKDLLMIYSFLNVKYEQIIKSLKTLNDEVKVYETIDNLIELINEQVNSYNIVFYYAINMVININNKNYITFYEVHQEFDELGVFKNKFEKDLTSKIQDLNIELKTLRYDVVKKLSIIESQLNQVIEGIDNINKNLNNIILNLTSIEESISNGFNSLNHNISENFEKLNGNLVNGLEKINSTIGFGNLINAIGVYQTYKINKNTKSLR